MAYRKKANIDPEISAKKAAAGSKGGRATKAKHGSKHFKEIGRKGARVFHQKYQLVPYQTSDFAIVDRQTGKIKNTMNGWYIK